jgi:hypothetical protein
MDATQTFAAAVNNVARSISPVAAKSTRIKALGWPRSDAKAWEEELNAAAMAGLVRVFRGRAGNVWIIPA